MRANLELHRRRESFLARAVDRATHLDAALVTNRRIGTAVGILMAQRKIPSDQAFELLSTASQQAQRKLRDLADEVTRTGTLPE
ncbi:MAG TPA: ANTAR domain-containing protein [Nakamurella sp.]